MNVFLCLEKPPPTPSQMRLTQKANSSKRNNDSERTARQWVFDNGYDVE